MKYKFLKIQLSFLLILIAMVAQTSCISDNSDPALLSDPDADLEKVIDETYDNPLENLRMDPTTLKMLAGLRAVTAKYHRIEVAMKDGYAQASDCHSSRAGGMGYNYVNFGIVDGVYDPTQPEALLYELDKNGKMKLVGVKFIIDIELWDSQNAVLPSFGMQEFGYGTVPLSYLTYQLHAWIWKNNQSGIFSMYNQNLLCN
jgi:hypothetical protein